MSITLISSRITWNAFRLDVQQLVLQPTVTWRNSKTCEALFILPQLSNQINLSAPTNPRHTVSISLNDSLMMAIRCLTCDVSHLCSHSLITYSKDSKPNIQNTDKQHLNRVWHRERALDIRGICERTSPVCRNYCRNLPETFYLQLRKCFFIKKKKVGSFKSSNLLLNWVFR